MPWYVCYSSHCSSMAAIFEKCKWKLGILSSLVSILPLGPRVKITNTCKRVILPLAVWSLLDEMNHVPSLLSRFLSSAVKSYGDLCRVGRVRKRRELTRNNVFHFGGTVCQGLEHFLKATASIHGHWGLSSWQTRSQTAMFSAGFMSDLPTLKLRMGFQRIANWAAFFVVRMRIKGAMVKAGKEEGWCFPRLLIREEVGKV